MSPTAKKAAAARAASLEVAPDVESAAAAPADASAGAAPAAAAPVPPVAGGDGSATCPWCSAAVPASVATCTSCGAALRDAAEGDVLGVTQIDPSAVSRAARIKPGRLATWLGAESTAESTDLGGRIEPPSKAVLEEMLRLEIAAIDAEIEAKATRAAAEKELPPDEGSEAKPT
jgi:hypothetical protein